MNEKELSEKAREIAKDLLSHNDNHAVMLVVIRPGKDNMIQTAAATMKGVLGLLNQLPELPEAVAESFRQADEDVQKAQKLH